LKLEVGESLSLSWLRHVRGCQVVQLNWKISPKALGMFLEDRGKYGALQQVFTAARAAFKLDPLLGDAGRHVLKTGVDFDQFIRQGEIDALGLRLNHRDSGHTDVHAVAVEVAFHEGGLNYGSKFESAARIAKKMLRGAFLLSGPLGVASGEVVFATPKVGNSTRKLIEPMVDHVREFWNTQAAAHHLPTCEFSFDSGPDFESKLLRPLLEAGQDVADTSELFLRSFQMLRMFKSE
jgi:hypothetical protein